MESRLRILRDTVMLLSLAISSVSQRLLLKAVTRPGNELSKGFGGNELLVYRNPRNDSAAPSCPGGERGWSAACGLLRTGGDSNVARAKSIVILRGGIMEWDVVFSH